MANPFGYLFGRPASAPVPSGLVPLGHAVSQYGGRPVADLVGSKFARDVMPQPYVGPSSLDRTGSETSEMRAAYDRLYREEPAVRSAIRGKVDSIIGLDVSVQPYDKTRPFDRLAADLCQWSIDETPSGWDGLLDMMLTPAFVHGHSFTEKAMKAGMWGRQRELGVPYVWTFDRFHSLDVAWIRLQLDIFWDVTAVVNIRRGLEYYSPENVILFTHNGMFGNPFGQSDLRAVWRACGIIEEAYRLWLITVRVYSLPYMVAKGPKERIPLLKTAMKALRGGGYATISTEDEIQAINLAAATGTSMFGELIKTLREDSFLSIRGSYTPFLEGQGGQNAHNDSEVSEDQANATETASIKRVCRTIRRQLFPWVVGPNCPPGTGIPKLHLGGTDWQKTKTFLDVVKGAQEVGVEPDADWVCETGGIVPGAPGKGLKAPQQQPQPGALPGGPGGPGGPTSGPLAGPLALPAGPSAPPKPAQPQQPDQAAAFADATDDDTLTAAADEFLAELEDATV